MALVVTQLSSTDRVLSTMKSFSLGGFGCVASVAAFLVLTCAVPASADSSRMVVNIPDGSAKWTTIDHKGGSRRVLVPVSSEVSSADTPAWSPSHKSVAFIGTTLYTLRADGSHLEQIPLPYSPFGYGNPTWSPDGRSIAFDGCAEVVFTDIEECARHAIYSIRRDGTTGLRRLAYGLAPLWMQDGQIAFMHEVRDKQSAFQRCYGRLSLMRPNGKDVTSLVPRGKTCHGYAPQDFTPDGRTLLLASFQNGFPNIYTLRLGGRPRLILKGSTKHPFFHARYSPSGRYLAWTHLDPGPARPIGLHVMRVGGHKASHIIDTNSTYGSFDW